MTNIAAKWTDLPEPQRVRYQALVDAVFQQSALPLVKVTQPMEAVSLLTAAQAIWDDRPPPRFYENGWSLMQSPVLYTFVITGK